MPTPSAIEFRALNVDDVQAARRLDAIAFGKSIGATPAESEVADFPLERSLGAFSDGDLVGIAAMLTLELTLPGGAMVPAAGLTWVSVLPTHRRLGIMGTLLERQLISAHARGELVSCLLASESHLYGRFGYGPATFRSEIAMDLARTRLHAPPEPHGSLRLLNDSRPMDILAPVWEQVRRRQVGAISRDPVWWSGWLDEEEKEEGRLLIVIHETDGGEADGYAVYRFLPRWHEGLARGTVSVVEVAAPDPGVRLALWRYLLDTDLADEIQATRIPPDTGLRWQLVEPRRLRTVSVTDDLWVRPLDVARCLAARTFAAQGTLLLEVRDPLFAHNDGVFELTATGDEVGCRRVETSPELSLDVAALGSVLLGGVAFARLAEAGLVSERSSGAVARADTLFSIRPAPFSGTDF